MEINPLEIIRTFEELDLRKELLVRIQEFNYITPSPIQSKGLLPLLSGQDLIVEAPFASGKTTGYIIGSLQIVSPSIQATQALILVASSVTAKVIALNFKELGQRTGVTVHAAFSSASMGPQGASNETIEAHIVVATPQCTLEMLKRDSLRVASLRVVVLDDGEKLLCASSPRLLLEVLQALPSATQACLYTSALEPEVLDLAESFMMDPVEIIVTPDELSFSGVRQYFAEVTQGNAAAMVDAFIHLRASLGASQSIVYCSSRKVATRVAEEINRRKVHALFVENEIASGDLCAFCAGEACVLVTTDTLDRKSCTGWIVELVVNFELPLRKENYLQRVGRNAQFNVTTTAVSLVSRESAHSLSALEEFYTTKIDTLPEALRL